MVKHKAIDILNTFSPDEFNDFDKFINSPFINRSRKLILFYKILKQNKNNFLKDDFTKELIFSKMKLNKEYNDSTMRNLFSDLYSVLKKYLTLINLYSDKDLQNIAFIKESSLRNLNLNSGLEFDSVVNHENDNEVSFNNFIYVFEHKMLEYRYNYLNTGRFRKENINIGESLLNDGIFYLLNYLTYRLILAENDLIVLYNNFSARIEDSPLHKLYLLFKDLDFEKVFQNDDISLKYMKLYFLITNSFIDVNNKDDYNIFKEKFDDIKDSLPGRIEYDLCKLAIYYNEYKIITNADDQSVLDAFYFTRRLFDKKLYLFSDAKNLNHFMFRSAINNALNNNNFKWAEDFIDNHSYELQPEFRNNVINLSWANYYYSVKKYYEALKFLNDFKSSNRVFNIEAKIINIKVLYESNDFESLSYSIDTFYKLVKSEFTFGESYKVFLVNFHKYLRKLINVKFNPEKKKELGYFLENLKKDDKVVNKLWLLEKYQELLK